MRSSCDDDALLEILLISKQHILVRNAIMLFLCREEARGKGCRYIIQLNLMAHGSWIAFGWMCKKTRCYKKASITVYKANVV